MPSDSVQRRVPDREDRALETVPLRATECGAPQETAVRAAHRDSGARHTATQARDNATPARNPPGTRQRDPGTQSTRAPRWLSL
jgi:hypothetical protein